LKTNYLSITEARIYGPEDAMATMAELFRAKLSPLVRIVFSSSLPISSAPIYLKITFVYETRCSYAAADLSFDLPY